MTRDDYIAAITSMHDAAVTALRADFAGLEKYAETNLALDDQLARWAEAKRLALAVAAIATAQN